MLFPDVGTHIYYSDSHSFHIAFYLKGVEPATTFSYLALPTEWYGALEWIFPTWARKHALDRGEAINFLKGAIVTCDRIVTVSQVLFYSNIFSSLYQSSIVW